MIFQEKTAKYLEGKANCRIFIAKLHDHEKG